MAIAILSLFHDCEQCMKKFPRVTGLVLGIAAHPLVETTWNLSRKALGF